MSETALDQAHAAMTLDPEDDAARLRFFERLGDAELFLLLTEEPSEENISPETFDIGPGTVVLVFDREERLAEFVGRAAPYAALSGRVVAGMLAGQGLGLALNPDVAPSSFVLAPEGVSWLAETLAHAPEEITRELSEVHPPSAPEVLVGALDVKLASATGLAQSAYLVATKDRQGGSGHLLAFVDAIPGAEAALAKAVNEALTFSGIEAGALDVGFIASHAEIAPRLARVGLRFDLPQPAKPLTRAAPGMDPEAPPILK